MSKYLVLLLCGLCALPLHAATFKSVQEIQYEWLYVFSVGKGEEVTAFKGDCSAKRSLTTGKLFTSKPINCFDTESEARVAAQKEADDFEKHMVSRRKVRPPKKISKQP